MQLGKVGKIVAAGTLAALMTGSSVAFAQLENFPDPFITSAGPQSLLVMGADADPSDVVGAVDIAARLGGEVTTDVAIPGSVATPSVVGEGRFIGTTNERVFLDDNMTKTGLRTALTSDDLPTILASDSIQGTTTDYDYDVFFNFGEVSSLDYAANDNVDPEDPEYVISIGSSINSANAIASQFFYRTRIVFNDELNVTDTANEELDIFGGDYTVSSDSTATKLVVFGSASTVVLSEGETTTISVGGVEHTVELTGVSDADTAVVSVDGSQQSMDQGQTRTINNVDVFIADVFFLSKETQVSSAEIGLGARKLTFQEGSKVKVESGGTTDSVDGTYVNLTSSSGKISRIDVFVVGEDNNDDLLAVGGEFTDPVWGNLIVRFDGITDGLMSAGRDKIEVKNSGTKELTLKFTNDRGKENSFEWAHITSSSDTTPALQDNNADNIEVVENETVTTDEYFIVDSGDFSRMFEVQDIDTPDSEAKVTLLDVFSSNELEVTIGSDAIDEKIIDGQTYYFDANGASLRVTWGTGATYNSTGSYTTVFPKLKTSNGAEIALTKPVTLNIVPNGHNIQLPTGAVTVSVNATGGGVNLTAANTEDGESTVITTDDTDFVGQTEFVQIGRTSTGGRWYNFTASASNGDGTTNLTISLATADGTTIFDPAVLLVEEEDADNNVYTVVIPSTTEGTTSQAITVGTIDMSYSGATTGTSLDSDSDIQHNMDKWGTFIVEDTDGQDTATIYYPDDQVSANIFVLTPGASVSSSGGSEGGTVKAAVPVKTPLGKLDTEITDADKNTKHLILVGGPAVNDLVTELATAGKTNDVSWYVDQGAGTALLDYVEDAFVSGRAALVVAGNTAADTRVASGKLQTFDTAGLSGAQVVLKNGVITTTTA